VKRTRLLGIALVTVLLLAALSGVGQARVNIEFWHALGGHIGRDVLVGYIDEFNESQDEVYVEPIYQGSYLDVLNQYRLAVQAGDTPNLVHVYEIGTRLMIDLDSTTPLQPFIDESDLETDYMVDNVLNYYTIDDQLYSMPFNTSNAILYYNKDMFREAGLDPESPPTTFEELREYAELMTGDGKHGFGNYNFGWYFEQLMAVQNAEYVNNDNGRTAPATEAVFNSEAGVRIFQWFADMMEDGSYLDTGRDGSALRAAFVGGNVGMRIGSTGGFASTYADIGDRFEMGAAFLPAPEGVERGGVIIGGGSIWMPKDHPQEKLDAAWTFLEHLASVESTGFWHVNTGYFPVDRRALDLPDVQQLHEEFPAFRTAIDQLEASQQTYATQGAVIGIFPEAREAIQEAYEQILLAGVDPQAALDEAADEVTTAIERYNMQMGF